MKNSEVTHNFDDLRLLEMGKRNENLRKEIPYLIESQIILAEYTHARYTALITAGFSKEDALWLIK